MRAGSGDAKPQVWLGGETEEPSATPTPSPSFKDLAFHPPLVYSLVPNLRMPGMAPWAGATSTLALSLPASTLPYCGH